MFTSLVFGAALTAPAAPIPMDTNPAPTGPAPWVVFLKADEAGRANILVSKYQKVPINRQVTTTENGKPITKIVQEQVERLTQQYLSIADQNAKFTTASGTTLTQAAAMKRLKDGAVMLVSADGKPTEKAWLRAIDPDAVIVSAEGLVSPIAPRPTVQVPTAAPRLVMLGTGPNGKVQVAYNPTAVNNGDAYGNGEFMGRANRVVFINNGAGAQPIFLNEDGSYNPNPLPATAEAPTKPLEEIKFDAYDLGGKRVARIDALKRMAAGGMVLVSGDSQIPDESYLKQFRGDLLVLVSPELLNVPVGGKGKLGALPQVGPGAIAPAMLVRPALRIAPLAVPAPAPAPAPAAVPAKAVLIQKAIPAQAIPELPAKPVEKPAKPVEK